MINKKGLGTVGILSISILVVGVLLGIVLFTYLGDDSIPPSVPDNIDSVDNLNVLKDPGVVLKDPGDGPSISRNGRSSGGGSNSNSPSEKTVVGDAEGEPAWGERELEQGSYSEDSAPGLFTLGVGVYFLVGFLVVVLVFLVMMLMRSLKVKGKKNINRGRNKK